MSVPIPDLLEPIKSLHRLIRDSVVQACEEQSVQALSAVAKEEGGDTIFQIDRVSEATLVEVLADLQGESETGLQIIISHLQL